MSAFAQPGSGGDSFNLKENGDAWRGALMLVWPKELKPNFDTGKFDPTDVVVCDIALIDRVDQQTGKPLFFRDAFLFSKGLVSNTRNEIGKMVLGRLNKKLFAQGEGWTMEEYTPQDAATAESYLAINPRDIFASPAPAAPAPADPWAAMNSQGTAPAPSAWQQTSAAPAAPPAPAPSTQPSAPAQAANGVDPQLVADLVARGISVPPGVDAATLKMIASAVGL